MPRFLFSTLLLVLIWAPARAGIPEAADYNAEKGGVSLVVIKNGAIVHESYPNDGGPDRAWALASDTKSFSGIIAAAAVQDGLLTLDERVARTLPEWRDDPNKSKITLRQILSLTSGIEPAGVGRPPRYAQAILQPVVAVPGDSFVYDPVNFQIFGEIMRRKLQDFEDGRFENAVDYLQTRVFDPLDIRPAHWRAPGGQPNLPSGARFTARDWARFGQFVLQAGTWNSDQLVDAGALLETLNGSTANPAYGLTWWLNNAPPAEMLRTSRTMRRATDIFTNSYADQLPEDLFMAAGAGKQRLYIIPSRNMVVVRQYPHFRERRFGQRQSGGPFSDVEYLLLLLAP